MYDYGRIIYGHSKEKGNAVFFPVNYDFRIVHLIFAEYKAQVI